MNVSGVVDVVMDDRYVYVIMPYFSGGELFSNITTISSSGLRMSETVARKYFLGLLKGVKFLHGKGVCHRDLSCENLMLNDDDDVVIIDLGMCLRIPYVKKDDGVTRTTIDDVDRSSLRRLIRNNVSCGKANYMSPEVQMKFVPIDGHAIDVWACGVILFVMLTGLPPFDVATRADARYNVVVGGGARNNVKAVCDGWNVPISDEAADLIQRIFRENPKDRIELEEILGHDWCRGG